MQYPIDDALVLSLKNLWRDQATMRSLHAVAARCAGLSRKAFQTQEIVTDTFTDMFTAAIVVERERSLVGQIRDEINRRGKRFRRQAQQSALSDVSLDALDELPRTAMIDAANSGELAEGAQPLDAAATVARIRELARDDAVAIQLLDLYAGGAVRWIQIRGSGMAQAAYRAARGRLAEYAHAAAARPQGEQDHDVLTWVTLYGGRPQRTRRAAGTSIPTDRDIGDARRRL